MYKEYKSQSPYNGIKKTGNIFLVPKTVVYIHV